jgi:hypothetical protein
MRRTCEKTCHPFPEHHDQAGHDHKDDGELDNVDSHLGLRSNFFEANDEPRRDYEKSASQCQKQEITHKCTSIDLNNFVIRIFQA